MSLSFRSHIFKFHPRTRSESMQESINAWWAEDEALGDLGWDKHSWMSQKHVESRKDFWIFSRSLKKCHYRAEEKNWIINATQLDGLRISIPFYFSVWDVFWQYFQRVSSVIRKFVVTIGQPRQLYFLCSAGILPLRKMNSLDIGQRKGANWALLSNGWLIDA